jgi:hypothetical protein
MSRIPDIVSDVVSLKSSDTRTVDEAPRNAETGCDAAAGMIGIPCVTGHFARKTAADWMAATPVSKKKRLSRFKLTGSLGMWVVSDK